MSRPRRPSSTAKEYIIRQLRCDMWRDFLTRAGESDEWASAFVSLFLLRGGTPPDEIRSTACELLNRQRLSGGWGYNATVPPDTDSTACCARVIRVAVPEATDALRAACGYLVGHCRDAGCSTYGDAALLRDYLGVDSNTSVSGWCERAHASVTASAALALAELGGALVNALRNSQRADGSWEAYWWCTPMYATTAAIDALLQGGDASDRARVTAALTWIAESQRADGSWDGGDGWGGGAFVTGLAALALASDSRYSAAQSRGLRWLRVHQRSDGSWDPCPILQIPPPWELDPTRVVSWKRGGLGAPTRIADQRRLFTTAVCYAAFNASPGGDHGGTS